MRACPVCKTAMKPLFSGQFCPNECDRPESAANKAYRAKLQADIEAAQDAAAKPKFFITPSPWVPWSSIYKSGYGTPISKQNNWQPGPGDCRDAYCRGKGTLVCQIIGLTGSTTSEVYQCTICGKQWNVSPNSNQVTYTVN